MAGYKARGVAGSLLGLVGLLSVSVVFLGEVVSIASNL